MSRILIFHIRPPYGPYNGCAGRRMRRASGDALMVLGSKWRRRCRVCLRRRCSNSRSLKKCHNSRTFKSGERVFGFPEVDYFDENVMKIFIKIWQDPNLIKILDSPLNNRGVICLRTCEMSATANNNALCRVKIDLRLLWSMPSRHQANYFRTTQEPLASFHGSTSQASGCPSVERRHYPGHLLTAIQLLRLPDGVEKTSA
jgi:hypothetical protein